MLARAARTWCTDGFGGSGSSLSPQVLRVLVRCSARSTGRPVEVSPQARYGVSVYGDSQFEWASVYLRGWSVGILIGIQLDDV